MTTLPAARSVSVALLGLLAACTDGETGRDFVIEPPSPRGFLEALSSTERVGALSTTLPAFIVRAHDGRDVLFGVPIVWQATGSGISISPIRDTTDAHGRAEAAVTLGPSEGQDTIIAAAPTLPGAPQVRFTLTAVTVMVEVRDLADGGFTPASVTVSPGRSVGWIYASAESDIHDVTFEDGPRSPELFELLWAGAKHHYVRLFEDSPRTVRYRCTYHSTSFADGEVGTVVVQQ